MGSLFRINIRLVTGYGAGNTGREGCNLNLEAVMHMKNEQFLKWSEYRNKGFFRHMLRYVFLCGLPIGIFTVFLSMINDNGIVNVYQGKSIFGAIITGFIYGVVIVGPVVSVATWYSNESAWKKEKIKRNE